MAANKAKRSIRLAQPERPRLNHEPAELMPVRAHVYRTIADMNGGFEHVIEGLQTLHRINYLRSDGLDGIHNLICRVRAQTNRQLMTILDQREILNVGHFQQLCIEPESR